MKFKEYVPFYRRNLKLAFPIVLSQIGQVTVSLADNIMVGHVGTTELAAAAFANSIFSIGMVFGMGVTMGLTPLVGKAFGNGNITQVILWLKNGIFTHFITAISITAIMFGLYFFLPFMGQQHEVLRLAKTYYLILCCSYLPFLLFFILKQFFEGIGNTKIAMQITLAANAVNIAVNYICIFGKFGIPEMGLNGAGIGTFVSRICMPLLFILFIYRNKRAREYFTLTRSQKLIKKHIVSLLKIGIPIGLQLIVEVAVFAIGSVMMGWIGEIQLAAHQVAMGMATLTYMISLGVSQANTIRVSHQMGMKDYGSMKHAVYASTHLVLTFMSAAAVIFIVARNYLPYLFVADANVVNVASSLLVVAAIFQVFDGLQVVMLSTLRGMADVTRPMFIAFLAYLLIGIPTSYIFAFVLKIGAQGIWFGYLVGLGIAGVMFYLRFLKNIKSFE